MLVNRVITGGQTGADLAGWKAAVACGIPVSGMMPPHFMNSDGRHREFADMYGATALNRAPYEGLFGEITPEGWKQAYRDRTRLNVEAADGLVWFGDHTSPGGRLTLRLARDEGKPFCVIPNRASRPCELLPLDHLKPFGDYVLLEDWIVDYVPVPRHLMVAGNRDNKGFSPENRIGVWVEKYLVRTFEALRAMG